MGTVTDVPRTRRHLLLGGLGGIAALLANGLGRPQAANAGVDGDVVLGAINTAATTTTVRNPCGERHRADRLAPPRIDQPPVPPPIRPPGRGEVVPILRELWDTRPYRMETTSWGIVKPVRDRVPTTMVPITSHPR